MTSLSFAVLSQYLFGEGSVVDLADLGIFQAGQPNGGKDVTPVVS